MRKHLSCCFHAHLGGYARNGTDRNMVQPADWLHVRMRKTLPVKTRYGPLSFMQSSIAHLCELLLWKAFRLSFSNPIPHFECIAEHIFDDIEPDPLLSFNDPTFRPCLFVIHHHESTLFLCFIRIIAKRVPIYIFIPIPR